MPDHSFRVNCVHLKTRSCFYSNHTYRSIQTCINMDSCVHLELRRPPDQDVVQMNYSALRYPSLSASAYIVSMYLCIPTYTKRHCRTEIRIEAKYLTHHLNYLGCMSYTTKCNDETTICSSWMFLQYSKAIHKPSVHKTGDLHTAVFRD